MRKLLLIAAFLLVQADEQEQKPKGRYESTLQDHQFGTSIKGNSYNSTVQDHQFSKKSCRGCYGDYAEETEYEKDKDNDLGRNEPNKHDDLGRLEP